MFVVNLLCLACLIAQVVLQAHLLDLDALFLSPVVMSRRHLEDDHQQVARGIVAHFAGRWAAKEAVLKALGTGWRKGISWRDVEIRNEPGGRPIVLLHGGAKQAADELGADEVLISISHCRTHATAFATAVRS